MPLPCDGVPDRHGRRYIVVADQGQPRLKCDEINNDELHAVARRLGEQRPQDLHQVLAVVQLFVERDEPRLDVERGAHAPVEDCLSVAAAPITKTRTFQAAVLPVELRVVEKVALVQVRPLPQAQEGAQLGDHLAASQGHFAAGLEP